MDINLPTMVLQAIAFLLLVGILSKLLYKPILELLDQRVAETNKTVDQVQKNQAEAALIIEQAKAEVRQAKEEAMAIRHVARDTAIKERETILEKAHEESENMVANARRDAQREYTVVKKSLSSYMANVAVQISEKMLMREIKPEDKNRYVQVFSKDVESQG